MILGQRQAQALRHKSWIFCQTHLDKAVAIPQLLPRALQQTAWLVFPQNTLRVVSKIDPWCDAVHDQVRYNTIRYIKFGIQARKQIPDWNLIQDLVAVQIRAIS